VVIGIWEILMKHTAPKVKDANRESHSTYCIAPLVFHSATRHGIVFLDLMRNRYSGLMRSDALRLSKYVDGIPMVDTWLGEFPESNTKDAALLDSLLTAGVLTRTPTGIREIVSTPVPLNGALTSIGDEIAGNANVNLWQIGVFLIYLISSAASLRLLPLRHVVRVVHRKRLAALAKGYKFNLSRAADLVATFRGIRPYFFLPKDKCLLHALTLTRYLAHHGEFPVWVLGVKTDPWAAHSWVQQGDFLLDCNPEKVCHLEQILGI
jgi:hypothetical protein